jgi:hypothetical protein
VCDDRLVDGAVPQDASFCAVVADVRLVPAPIEVVKGLGSSDASFLQEALWQQWEAIKWETTTDEQK